MFSLFFPIENQALAGPEDGVVVSGSATISTNGTKTDIYQASQNTLIDWRSFDTNINETTQFHQPSSSSIAVNRVNSNARTQINGKLIANGNIVIINQNGVAFGAGANVDVNGLVATTSTLDEASFIDKGALEFSASEISDASILNEGRITAREAGLIGLVAPQVENRGIINAKLGKVQLASGNKFSVDFYGAGLMGVTVSDDVGDMLVRNTGTINAEGGQISLTAAATKDIVDSLIDVQGELHAPTFSQKNGKIIIGAEGSNNKEKSGLSNVIVSAKLDASGEGVNETGGYVEITGDNISVTGSSSINASGYSGGGKVLIGGEYQGGGELETALQTNIGSDVVIDVSATQNGDGGQAIIWADDHTQFDGEILAKAGSLSGNGGLVETSGKNTLGVTGRVNAGSENGNNGTWLLDPNNITIQDAGPDSDVTQAPAGTFTTDNDGAIVTTASIETALASTDVIVQTASNGGNAQEGDVTVADQIDWSSNNNLTIDADNDINVNATITNTGTGGLSLNAGLDGAGDIDINSEINIGGDLQTTATGGSTFIGADIATNGGDITLNGSTTVTDSDRLLDAGSGVLSISTDGIDAGAFNVVLGAGDFNINGLVDTGSSRTATFLANTTLGLGTGASGAALIDDVEMALLSDTASRIAFSTDDGTVGSGSDIDIHNLSVSRNQITVDAGIGSITVDSGGVMSGATSQTLLSSDDFVIDGTISGSGRLIFNNNTRFLSLGLGSTATGANNLNDDELSRIVDGFTQLSFVSNDGDFDVEALTWNDNVALVSSLGTITVDGVQNLGGNNLTFGARSDIDVDADLIGTGILTFGSITSNQDFLIGDDAIAAGSADVEIDDQSLSHIADGWSQIQFGSQNLSLINADSRNITFDTSAAYEFKDPVIFQGFGDIVINSELVTAAGSDTSFTFDQTSNAIDTLTLNEDIDTSAAMAGSGAVIFNNITALELGGNISTAGGDIIIDNTVAATSLETASRLLNADSGTISIGAGGVSAGSLELTFRAEDFSINGNLSGTNELSFQVNNDETLGIGTGQAGTANIDDAELARIQNGFSEIAFQSIFNGDLNIGAYTWLDNVAFNSIGTGQVLANGIQNFGGNDASFRGDVNLNAALNGTGTITFDLLSGGIGDNATGNANLIDDTELGFIADGFNEIVFTGNNLLFNTNGYEFTDPTTILSRRFFPTVNVVVDGDLIAAAGSDASFTFTGDSSASNRDLDTLTINANIDTTAASTNGQITFGDFINDITLGGNLNTNGADITFNDGAAVVGLSSTSNINAATGAVHVGANGITGNGNDLSLQAASVNIAGDIDATGQVLDISASAGDINQTAGVLTASSLNLDATGVITADIDAQNVDIGNQSTATTLTGFVNTLNDQTGANLIVGGPGDDVNHVFEGFTIRDASTLPPESSGETPQDSVLVPNTVELTVQSHRGFLSIIESSQDSSYEGNELETNDTSETDDNKTQHGQKSKDIPSVIKRGLVGIHPKLAAFFDISL